MNSRCAIIGADLVAALGAGIETVWAQMMRKTCGIRPMTRLPRGIYGTDYAAEVPPETLAELRAREAGGASGPARVMALGAARRMLQAVAGGPQRVRRMRAGLVLSTTKAESAELKRLASEPGAGVRPLCDPYALACDVAQTLGLSGPVMAVSNACASGLVALAQAAQALCRGYAEAMMVIGVDVIADFVLAGFSSLKALSPQPCRPYDAARDGLSLGEGAGALLLASKTRSDDRVLSELAGWGITNDACHITAPSRTGEGLRSAVVKALAAAGLTPDEVDYVNGHGTATVYNDEMEANALHSVFGGCGVPVGSIKGYLGHTLGAAGVIEVVLSLEAMRQRTVPACLGLSTLGVGRPLHVPQDHLALSRLQNVLSINSGFGGVNAAVILTQKQEAK